MRGFGISCRRIRRLLSDRLDNPLSLRDEQKVTLHLASCADCRASHAFYRNLKETAAHIENAPAPGYLWERITVALDEHPWGEDTPYAGIRLPFPFSVLKGQINYAGAVLSLALIALFTFAPGTGGHDVDTPSQTATSGDVSSTAMESVSLFLTVNSDHFPPERQEYYLNHMQGLEQKIQTIKSALVRYPHNRHIMAQLALAYEQKIGLYRELGLGSTGSGAQTHGDLAGDDDERDGRYE